MLAAGLRRLALIYVAIVAGTIIVSAVAGLLVGSGLERAVAVGLYIAGALLLVGCFIVGARGPLRGVSREGETTSVIGARRVRTATSDERSEATRTALLLFAFGVSLVILGSLVDPARSTF